MANPQLENGYTQIANEILDALAKVKMSSYQQRVMISIIRKTYGYHKKIDRIAISQLVEMTGIHKAHISRTIKELIQRNIVTRTGNKIGFNKDYTGWRQLPKGVTSHKVTRNSNRVTRNGNKKLPEMADSKEKTKTISKENFSSDSTEYRLSELLLNFILKRRTSFKKPNLQTWAKHIDYTIRIDNRAPEEIEDVIIWCQKDSFWQNNILSVITGLEQGQNHRYK